jgi:uncharacterized glyoxalase superfamily protein PhnB
MSEKIASGPVGFESSIPILSVRNVPASIEHYCTTLGFTKNWDWTDEGHDEPNFASVIRGDVNVFLCQGGQGSPGMWIYLTIHLTDDIDRLHREYELSGAKIVQAPTDKPWGNREMLVEDPDGHVLRIGAPTHHTH